MQSDDNIDFMCQSCMLKAKEEEDLLSGKLPSTERKAIKLTDKSEAEDMTVTQHNFAAAARRQVGLHVNQQEIGRGLF